MFTFSFYCDVKRKSEPKKKNTLFICNPTDCTSPNGRTPCRCSILSLAPLGRECPKDRRGAKILQSFTAPIITGTAGFNGGAGVSPAHSFISIACFSFFCQRFLSLCFATKRKKMLIRYL